jgi:LruC domain-containing protein
VSADVLAVVNASLPEGQPLPASHPEYLAAGNELDLVLRDSAEVWITFVHEGAGWKNALGFYTYDADAPPASPAAIDARTIVFPNVSFAGEGGGLVAGDRVRLGAFPAGTALGWFLVGNGWTGSGVGAGYHTVYSNPAFNPEPDPALRQHNVLLADAARELVLLGFEDVRRDNIPIGCDQDFNDAVFYVTATPFEAVETAALPATDPDAEPVEEAFRTFAPGEGTLGTLAFEDLWPGRGDYDFNDLVVDYRFDLVAGADQRVTELRGRFVTRAVGASFRNGFGFALPVPPEAVAAVEGSDLQAGVVVTRANGTEAGQSQAVVIVYDDASRRLRRPSGFFANTQPGAPVVTPDTIDVTVRFATPVDPGVLGAPPFNPFLIVNGRREKEVHLPDHPPTDLADASLFGTSADASRPGEGRFYKTDDNRPWALHLPSSFVYPVEKAAIEAGHLRFGAWARANGTRHADWYLDRAGYRDPAHLYDLD